MTNEERRARSYELSVCKEALLKGIGVGLAADPARVSIGRPAVGERASVSAASFTGVGASWSVALIDAGAGYVAAVAAEGNDWRVQLETASAR